MKAFGRRIVTNEQIDQHFCKWKLGWWGKGELPEEYVSRIRQLHGINFPPSAKTSQMSQGHLYEYGEWEVENIPEDYVELTKENFRAAFPIQLEPTNLDRVRRQAELYEPFPVIFDGERMFINREALEFRA